ncbi:cobalamin biosynthesis protein [Kitasatospora sp. NPDC003701]
MIGLLALDAAGRLLAGELHALWPDSSTVFRAADDGESPGELLERALGNCRQLVCCAPVPSIVRLLLDRSPAGRERPGGLDDAGGPGGAGGPDGSGGPGVVCVDPARRFAVSLTGPGTGADELADEVSALLDTTCPVRPDGPAVGAPVVDTPVVGALVVGVGLREAAALPDVARLIRRALREAGPAGGSVVRLATLTGKGDHPAVRHAAALLGVPVDEHTAEELSAVAVPNPSATVGAAVGTLSVAEAAALASAPGGELVIPKQKSATVTVAVARPAVTGRLAVVGLGDGLAYAPPPSDRYALVRIPGPPLLVDADGDHS